MAAYELVRQGVLARDRERLGCLVSRLRDRFGPMVDLAVLAVLAAGTPPPAEGTPLVIDGATASGGRAREGYVPNERCGWTVWHRWD